jgi:nitric oxide reductase NorD protein
VAVLVDASSSTDETVNDQRIIDIEKAALSLLASALALTGDVFGMFSFFSLGRRLVFFNIIKDFDEPWDSRARGRIPSVDAYAANRDGCAIRHAAARLSEQPERTKLLILLSDGIPADPDYGSSNAADTSHYAIEDTRRAIIEARLAGIIPYCLTVDRFARRYIPRLYGDYSYTILNDVALLPQKLSRLYLRLTR